MKKYRVEEKEKLIEQWKGSGKSQCAYAKEKGINPQTFYKWTERKKDSSSFVELKTESKWSSSNNREIILEHGETRIRIPFEISEQEMNVVITLWKYLV